MKIFGRAVGWKQSKSNYLAAAFSLLSGLLWLLAAATSPLNRTMWAWLAVVFLVQGGFWYAIGEKARKQGK